MNDHTALVVGGTSGIGLATARRLLTLGATVQIVGRRKLPVDDLSPPDPELTGHPAHRAARVQIACARPPGLADTPWWSGLPDKARQAYFAQAAQTLPTRRIAAADDIAEVVVLAATNANITGSIIETDGGAHLVSMG